MKPSDLLDLMAFTPMRANSRMGPEDMACIDFATRLRAASLEKRLSAAWTHIPHEVGGGTGFRAALRYQLAKAMGLVPGSADYAFVWKGGGGWIEFKSGSGSLSRKQRQFRDWCQSLDVHWALARSADEGEALLREWGVLK